MKDKSNCSQEAQLGMDWERGEPLFGLFLLFDKKLPSGLPMTTHKHLKRSFLCISWNQQVDKLIIPFYSSLCSHTRSFSTTEGTFFLDLHVPHFHNSVRAGRLCITTTGMPNCCTDILGMQV